MTCWPIVWPLLLGFAGWTAAEFLGRPLREFFRLRREIRLRMLTLGDARNALWEHPAEISDAERLAQQAALRQLGVQTIAFGDSERLARVLLRPLGHRPVSAGRAAVRFAEAIDKGDREFDAAARALNRALAFKRRRR